MYNNIHFAIHETLPLNSNFSFLFLFYLLSGMKRNSRMQSKQLGIAVPLLVNHILAVFKL